MFKSLSMRERELISVARSHAKESISVAFASFGGVSDSVASRGPMGIDSISRPFGRVLH
jgi:hypothetical protein